MVRGVYNDDSLQLLTLLCMLYALNPSFTNLTRYLFVASAQFTGRRHWR